MANEPPSKVSDEQFHKDTCSACQQGKPQKSCPQ